MDIILAGLIVLFFYYFSRGKMTLTLNDLNDIYKYVDVGILELDNDLNFVSSNPFSTEIFKENPVGKNIKKYIPENGKSIDSYLKELFDIKDNLFADRGILKWINSNNDYIYLSIIIIKEDNKTILICHDLTEREKAFILLEKKKLETEQILNGLVKNNFSYSMRERDNKRVFTVSSSLKELFGFTDEDIPSEYEGYIPWFARVPESHRVKAIANFEKFIKNDSINEVESIYPFIAADGEIVNIQTNSIKIKDINGKFKAIVGTIRRLDDVLKSLDILQDKTSNQEQLNQRQNAFNTFILRSILYSIVGFVWFAVLSVVRGDNRVAIDEIAGLAEILLIVQLLPPVIIVGLMVYRILIFMGKEENKNV